MDFVRGDTTRLIKFDEVNGLDFVSSDSLGTITFLSGRGSRYFGGYRLILTNGETVSIPSTIIHLDDLIKRIIREVGLKKEEPTTFVLDKRT